MRQETKRPGRARERSTGADEEIQMRANFQNQVYVTCRDLQTRHLRHRCGLSDHRARLIALLFFGEGRQ